MGILLLILLALVLYLSGCGVMRCFYGNQYKENGMLGEILPAGFCVLIGAAEVSHLAAVFLGWPVSRMALLWAGMMGVLAVFGVIVILAGSRKPVSDRQSADGKKAMVNRNEQLLMMVFTLSVVFQIIMIMTGDRNCNAGDMTLETVRTFLAQDQVYHANPLTGQPYTAGIPLRLKILSFPGLYASVCSVTGLDAELVVCRIVPVIVLLVSYFAYSVLGKILFGTDRTGRLVMLLVISVLYWCGDYMDAMDGYLLLHSGYRGVAIRNGILIPFTLGMCLQRKWKTAILAILAEACIVWTLYGLGACLLVVVVMLLIDLWIRAGKRRGGKACRNS